MLDKWERVEAKDGRRPAAGTHRPMKPEDLAIAFESVLDDIVARSAVTDAFLNRDTYRLYIATLWSNVVLNPREVGIEEGDLEALHEIVNDRVEADLGQGSDITECFRFINSKAGELAMQQASLTQTHKELLLYFSSMILDPEGHKRWMDDVVDEG